MLFNLNSAIKYNDLIASTTHIFSYVCSRSEKVIAIASIICDLSNASVQRHLDRQMLFTPINYK